MQIKIDRLILAMDDDELEKFSRCWVEILAEYKEVRRFAGPGDKGRDVVGFLSAQRHEADWDNYQCKQYRKRLSLDEGLLAVGKVLYWASRGEFTPPRKFFFVAPKGLNQKLMAILDKPSEFKSTLVGKWGSVCAQKIILGKRIDLDTALSVTLDTFDYTAIYNVGIDEMLANDAIKPLLFSMYGIDPGEYPRGSVPANIHLDEMTYVLALLEAYNERENMIFDNPSAVFEHATHGKDLCDHRERFFEAEAFQKFYRDNTSPDIISSFRRDIHFGVKDKLKTPAADTLARIDNVMAHASTIIPAGPLAKYAYIPVKQGFCHHLVNDNEMTWKTP